MKNGLFKTLRKRFLNNPFFIAIAKSSVANESIRLRE